MLKVNNSIRESENSKKDFNAALLVTILILLTIIPKFIITKVFDSVLSSEGILLAMLYVTGISCILIYIFARKVLARNNKSLGLINPKRGKNYLKGALFGFVAMTGIFLQLKVYNLSDISYNYQNISPLLFLAFIVGWLIQGFQEELMCRSILMNYFACKNGVKSAIITNSLIFAIMHIGNDDFTALAFVNIFLLGVIFSILFYISDDIFFPAAAHSFWNLTQGNIYGFNVSGISKSTTSLIKTRLIGNEILTGGAFGVEAGSICFFIEVVLLVALSSALRQNKVDVGKNS